MASKNNQNLFITIILVVVLISIIFLTIKVYDLYTLNNVYKKMNDYEEDIVFESDNVNLIPVYPKFRNRWHFWPSNWNWKSNSELGNRSFTIDKYSGPGPRGGVAKRQFGNYCPYAGSCPLGGWKGCPYGSDCPGPENLPFIEITKMPSLQYRFD